MQLKREPDRRRPVEIAMQVVHGFFKTPELVSLYIQSRMIAPPGWAPLQSKQSVLSLIVLSDWSSLN